MSDSNRLSRRQWFRLRDASIGSGSPGDGNEPACNQDLTPIAHPPNHDGMDLAQLPPLREATLQPENVAALFSDIEQLGSDIQLMQRSRDSSRATAACVTVADQLQRACRALLTGEIQRVQIRYLWRESRWIDTLERRDAGFRLVRVAHRSRPGGRPLS